MRAAAGCGDVSTPGRAAYGVVVVRVNVSVLLYVPVRSASFALICCLNVTGTDSLEVGALHVLTVPRPCSGCGEREGAVDQVARVVRARVGDAQRRVARRRDDGGGRGRRVLLRDARRERRRRRPERPSSAPASPGRCRRRRRRRRRSPTRAGSVPPTTGIVNELLPRSSVSCVPAAGWIVYWLVAREHHQRQAVAGRDDRVLGLHVEVDLVEGAGRDRVGHVVRGAVLRVTPAARQDRARRRRWPDS